MSESQPNLPGVKQDPVNYRKLSEPFPSLEAAQKTVDAFFDEFYALRNKHGIRDASLVVAFKVVTDDGGEGEVIVTFHAGDQLMQESMLAYAFGQASAERQQRTAKLINKRHITQRRED